MNTQSTPSFPIVSATGEGCSVGCGQCRSGKQTIQVVETSVPKARTFEETLLQPEEQVLPTLERDGTRRWMQPRLSAGKLWQRRRMVAYVLMLVFIVVPHLRISGKPLILLDIPSRQFTILGHTFLPSDSLLLVFLMLSGALTIVLGTAIAGRVWCGWGCPQTVFMEFLFRPIDRLFDGTVGKGGAPKKPLSGWKRWTRYAVYVVFSMGLAHTLLAYFIGTDRLAVWVRSSPIEHPTAFIVMGLTTAFVLFDSLFFREQLCLIACPYGRFQSVMLDRRSLIVAYDYVRGEPRHKGKRALAAEAGHCVDCNRCVTTCPTGIDIRKGLQLECINCAQCIDACNEVMQKTGLPQGLIRYSSQDALEGKHGGLIRPRTIIYPILLTVAVTAFTAVLSTKFAFDARIMRAPGAPFTIVENRMSQNNLRLRLVNRSNEKQTYQMKPLAPEGLTAIWADGETPELEPGKTRIVPVIVRIPGNLTARFGHIDGRIMIDDGADHQREIDFQILGPR